MLDKAIIGLYIKVIKRKEEFLPELHINILRNIQVQLRFFIQCVVKEIITLPEYFENGMVFIRYISVGSDGNWKLGASLLNITVPWPNLPSSGM